MSGRGTKRQIFSADTQDLDHVIAASKLELGIMASLEQALELEGARGIGIPPPRAAGQLRATAADRSAQG